MSSNMYEVNATDVLEAYGEFIDGTPQAVILVLSAKPLAPVAAEALRASFASFGYGEEACAWVTLENTDPAFRGMVLGAPETMNVVEGLDPLIIVAADQQSVDTLASAYHAEIPIDTTSRLLGRPIAAFHDFRTMLNNEKTKQQAWSPLKQLFN